MPLDYGGARDSDPMSAAPSDAVGMGRYARARSRGHTRRFLTCLLLLYAPAIDDQTEDR
ncbi:hypothetical protein [Actinomadura keratinilytica]|uniref:hypothetical protein n=1 Tax=Actinomadura keratinilytica TaxID=547461 RepID=UPI00360CEE62